ncbi:MAG: hypothetical protein GTO18_10050 [Anaerolineales bacterium]|nr:hypothetical protein [Anaerolineales bacterium]
MNFDLRTVPFSRFGSYIAFSHLERTSTRDNALYMRSIHGTHHHPDNLQELFRVDLMEDMQAVAFNEVASPSLLRLECESGYAEICIQEPKLVRIRCQGVTIRFHAQTTMFDNAIPRLGDRWEVTSHRLQTKYMLTPHMGELVVEAPWNVDRTEFITFDIVPDSESGIGECTIEEFMPVWRERETIETFDEAVGLVEAEFSDWLKKMPEVPEVYREAGELAAYITWSCVVEPSGLLQRPAMLMSKNWMTSLWSWDNCFNAIALSYKKPEMAWDQFMILIDHQDESGVFPDSISDRLEFWTFCKPPIHGWALDKMLQNFGAIHIDRLNEVYEPLKRWNQWWFKFRDDDGDGIPQYNHGNDSGWDNSTVFTVQPPIESPDLTTYIIIQMEVISKVAELLGKENEARGWKGRAQVLSHLFLSHSWKYDRFVALRSGDHTVIDSESLLLFIPLLLGERLPARYQEKLIEGLTQEGRFITEFGLASESPKSPYYEPDGYWRGPIWAPSTMLLVDALAACGEPDLAKEISRRFCDMALKSGMAENFNALTGEGLRDQAYTWTASVFLILAHEYLME